MTILIKRVYEEPSEADGKRILVDRLWPRGLTKAEAKIDVWFKDVAPSSGLRQWFGHDPAKWDEFARRYTAELDGNREAVEALEAELDPQVSTLVYSAKDEAHNQAVVLKAYLDR